MDYVVYGLLFVFLGSLVFAIFISMTIFFIYCFEIEFTFIRFKSEERKNKKRINDNNSINIETLG